MKNFLPGQYRKDKKFKIKHNYLSEQFYDYNSIFKESSPAPTKLFELTLLE